jgi:hypothetical protein
MEADRLPFWSDDFDGDLYRLLPEVEEFVAPAAAIRMWTYSGLTHGRINCPTAWHTARGLTSFFTLVEGRDPRPDRRYYVGTDEPVECTGEEFFRDLLSHGHIAVVDNVVVDFGRLQASYFALLFHVRGHGNEQKATKARPHLINWFRLKAQVLAQIAREVTRG